ncbi:MAG: hypothetical protein COV72_01895 [Candidatus Omnitrophica bacterium CG11_big_fil_rev_8_21_14_0_20_42_13]|uniref:Uncharacterized protein n=1 Tax=Candidatus Ghiorseimicrobium undicola TaxID=1974746 RepID=A0A2H0LZ31_9BACT|nr:MAG: hypothetical protein COV72_01895 [Candidatus Omnitrophica bacterium CG11_big_fil_rev_8_21_14_0_20_42_13]
MKKITICACVAILLSYTSSMLQAAEHAGKEHGGKEHGGKEHGGKEMSEPSSTDIRLAMKAYVAQEVEKNGSFKVYDDKIDKTRKLSLIRIHERVGKTGGYYYSCADFKDIESGETIDVDLDVEEDAGELKVVDVRIHKVGGRERYTYDEDDNRIPIKD